MLECKFPKKKQSVKSGSINLQGVVSRKKRGQTLLAKDNYGCQSKKVPVTKLTTNIKERLSQNFCPFVAFNLLFNTNLNNCFNLGLISFNYKRLAAQIFYVQVCFRSGVNNLNNCYSLSYLKL